jgi:5-methylcytosine-specific restriction endonuclease McrA
MEARKKFSRPYTGKNKRRKIEVQCQGCMEWFPPSRIQMDHIIPCGSIKGKNGKMTGGSLLKFLNRLTPERTDAFQPLCKECHKIKTKKERAK